MSSTLSVLGLYQWDNSLLDGVVKYLPTPSKIPTDYPDLYYPGDVIDPDMFKHNLLMECAELEVIYPDFDFLKWAVETWALKQSNVWQKFYNTCYYKYNPLWNKDGKITRTETEERDLQTGATRDVTSTTSRDTTNDVTRDLTDAVTRDLTNAGQTQTENTRTVKNSGNVKEDNNGTSNGTSTEQVSAFNSADFRNRSQVEDSQTVINTATTTQDLTTNDTMTSTTTGNNTDSGTITTDSSGTVKTVGSDKSNSTDKDTSSGTETGTITRTYEDLEQGNIGITMSQQMAQAERDYVKFNIVDFIIDDFKKRFCLLVY